MSVELMALKVPTGWAVTYNDFYDVEREFDVDGELANWGYFTQDLMQVVGLDLQDDAWCIQQPHVLMDLGWYPDGDPDGRYRLNVVVIPGWETVTEVESVDRQEIRVALEALMAADSLIRPFENSSQSFDAAAEALRLKDALTEEGVI